VKFGLHQRPPSNIAFGNSNDPSSKSSTPHFRISNGTLTVTSFCLDVIKKIPGCVSYGVIQYDSLEMSGWMRDKKKNPGKVTEKLWRTLVAYGWHKGINALSWYHQVYLQCLSDLNNNGDLYIDHLLNNVKGLPENMHTFLERVQRIIYNRKILHFITSLVHMILHILL